MQDPFFGKIELYYNRWKGAIRVPFFAGFGRSFENLDENAADHISTIEKNGLPIEIETKRGRPSKLQRDAFAQITRRRDKLWTEVMDALTAEYQKQRPKRLRYWKNLYGMRGIKKSLPPVKKSSELKPLLMPIDLHVKAAGKAQTEIDIDILFALTWFSDGAFVTIREGRVFEVNGGASWLTHTWPLRMIHPVFGILRRPLHVPSWLGIAGAGPFADWAAVSIDRAIWDESATERELDSNLNWQVARGGCFVRVYVDEKKGPSTTQTAAHQAFRKNEDVAGKAIQEALFDYYQANLKASREAYTGKYVQRAIPKIKKPDDLKNITELELLNVFPDAGEHPLATGLIFKGAWTGPTGVGVRWSEGRIEEIGNSDVATPAIR